MANTFIDIGKIVPVFTGDYSPSRVYEFNDLVRSNNIIYWHVERDSTVGVQPPAAGVWMKLLTSGGGTGGISDVQVNGTSITADGVANIPIASTTDMGVVKLGGAGNGIGLGSANQLYVASASDAEIDNRGSNYKPIVPKNLDSAVTAVLTDGKAPALTDAQKAQAQSWLGIDTILGLVEAVSEVVG